MKRVVVTGGTGFVGANLVRRLIADGHQTHLLVRPEFSSWRIDSIRDRITVHEVGLSDADRLTSVLKAIAPGWVFHLAAHGAYPWQTDEAQMRETNVRGTRSLLTAALDTGVESFVNTGSSSEYGRQDHAPIETESTNPDTPYGRTKAIATAMCVFAARFGDPTSEEPHMAATRISTLRLYSAYGPFEDPRRLLPSLIVHGRRGVLPPLVNPQTARDFVYVDDVVDACLLAAQHESGEPGAIYNVGTGVQTTVGEAVDVARRVLGISDAPQWGSMPARVWDTDTWVADSRRIRTALGWEPRYTFEEGFRQMAAWLDQHPELRERYEAAWP
jgi:nucleoside-diphosphate-sugar epimerase